MGSSARRDRCPLLYQETHITRTHVLAKQIRNGNAKEGERIK